MASDNEEDDYLSDKFLLAAEQSATKPNQPKTYAQRRREAERVSQLKNEQNRTKSLREREKEALEEGLSKSLFERAKEEEERIASQGLSGGTGGGNKALSMMMKMGFQPGQALGRRGDSPPSLPPAIAVDDALESSSKNDNSNATSQSAADRSEVEPLGQDDKEDASASITQSDTQHRTVPLPLQEWTGRQGIGIKRKVSPSVSDRVAKMAKLAAEEEERSKQMSFRERTRREYEERRAEGRLPQAQRTCVTLDEENGMTFNTLWLNPKNPESFPEGLIEALEEEAFSLVEAYRLNHTEEHIAARIKRQMEADALHPLEEEDNDDKNDNERFSKMDGFPPEMVKEAAQFLRLQAQDRLKIVLSYLREKYLYCYWCGTKYESQDELDQSCPGAEEEDHD